LRSAADVLRIRRKPKPKPKPKPKLKLKLTCFDFHGGRGEIARLALAIGGVEFEDERVPTSEWRAFKSKTPFGALPTLEVDGHVITQSNTINRYTGKLAKLYPVDMLQAAYCDEVMDALEDIVGQVVSTFAISDEVEKKAKREPEGVLVGSKSALESSGPHPDGFGRSGRPEACRAF
jgi:glutathione S-transferase